MATLSGLVCYVQAQTGLTLHVSDLPRLDIDQAWCESREEWGTNHLLERFKFQTTHGDTMFTALDDRKWTSGYTDIYYVAGGDVNMNELQVGMLGTIYVLRCERVSRK
jgi:hypothetical protein